MIKLKQKRISCERFLLTHHRHGPRSPYLVMAMRYVKIQDGEQHMYMLNKMLTEFKAKSTHFPVSKYLPALFLLALLPCVSCVHKTNASDSVTMEGIYIKNLGHPFSGAAIMAGGEYYRISEDSAAQIHSLQDKTKLKITGTVSSAKRTIPEAGKFREITEKIIKIDSFEVIE